MHGMKLHTYIWSIMSKMAATINNRPAGPMVRRLTTNQEIAGSTPASVILFFFFCRFILDIFFYIKTVLIYWNEKGY